MATENGTIRTEGLYYTLFTHLIYPIRSSLTAHTNLLLNLFPTLPGGKEENMVLFILRAFVLFIFIVLLAFLSNGVCGLRSADHAHERSREDRLEKVKNHRVLKAPSNNCFNTTTTKKPGPLNKKFNSGQSSKRKVRRGSDPIHNRS